MKIHHIGYLVENIEAAIEQFLSDGGTLIKSSVYDKNRLVDIAFVEVDNLLIELVSPHEGSEDVGKSIQRLKCIPYHLCFECDNLEDEIERKVQGGDMLVKDPQYAIALENRRVAFFYSEQLGLYEVVEK